jgi:hypothetical protein
MIPPYGRTPQEVYNDLNEELKTKGFEFDKYFTLDDNDALGGDYRFPNDTSFFFDVLRSGKPVIRSCDAFAVTPDAVFLFPFSDAFGDDPQVVRTIATVAEQLLNGWPYDESLAPTVKDTRRVIRFVSPYNDLKFCIKDGDHIRIQDKSDPTDYMDLKCRYHSDRYLVVLDYPLISGPCRLDDFAFRLKHHNKQVIRIPTLMPTYDVAFCADGKMVEWESVPVADEETMLKNLVGDVIATHNGYSYKFFKGTKGSAMFGKTGDDELTSLHPRYLKSTNKAKASNTETDTKVASAKKDTGRGR